MASIWSADFAELQDTFWVLFEPNAGGNKSPKPPLERIPRKNLVALPTSPHGALETQWEANMPRHCGTFMVHLFARGKRM